MRAVFVSYYHPQDRMAAAARLQRTLTYLQEKGWSIEVVSPPCQDPEKRGPRSPLTRVLSRVNTALGLTFRALTSKGQVYFVSAPPFSMMIPAMALKLFKRKSSVVFEERDLLSLNPILTFRAVRGSYWMQALEHRLLRVADAVTVASRGTKAELEKGWSDLTLRARPIEVVSNGFFKKDYENLEKHPIANREGPLEIVHIGNFYGSRHPAPLLQALEELKTQHPEVNLVQSLRFVFVGKFQSDDDREAFQKRATEAGIRDLFVLKDLVPRSEALRLVTRADVAFLITHQKGTEWAVPAKLYEYIALSKPILALSGDAPVIEPIERYQLGWAIEHADQASLMKLLLWMIEHPEEIRARTLPGMMLQEFDAEAQLQKFDQLLRDVCRK
jgi:glycosyltransferase involved in cell wall biosynthesis